MSRAYGSWRFWLIAVTVGCLLPFMVWAADQEKTDSNALKPDTETIQEPASPPSSLEDMMRSMEQKMDQMLQSPFGQRGRMPRWFDDDFGLFPGAFKGGMGKNMFPVRQARSNITQKDDNIIVTIDLPGHDKSTIDLRIKDRALILKSERKSMNKEDKDNKVFREEISYGSFSQIFELPRKVLETQAKASYADGVLTVTLPVDKTAPQDEDGFKIPVN
ncbi:MAG TPA: Hsp20/alpha crystallin family protein [Candidatus Ozemobacteraceae bacterium]|nr:Hsp20/alpha crystallin family protein [Candidatus Ozemobacteraceae bacterium]HQG26970.1 Hsp20/alpha crystallin family protein [Candidatus Ozemobacteraceae bacterium]